MSEATQTGSVTFVGSGPGEFGLLTLVGARTLKFADLIIIDPAADPVELGKYEVGHAEIVHAAEDQAAQILDAVNRGLKVVRLSVTDHFVEAYSTDLLPKVLEEARVRVNIIPGLSHWSTVLGYGAIPVGRTLATMEARDDVPPVEEWPSAETLVIRTSGALLGEMAAQGVQRYGDDGEVLLILEVATTRQSTTPLHWSQVEAVEADECYLVVSSAGTDSERQRLAWFESKPLFDWRILSPRTKDDLTPLVEELAQFGATCETIPTMSIEPPRTEQAMERAMRGLVDGRYMWCLLTSPYAVDAISERLHEYGLDSRALSGVQIGAVGRGTQEALRKLGIVADLTPDDEDTVAGLAAAFPAFDELMDPLNRVLVPSADVSVDALVDGLEPLGWEVEPVTAYRTVRAAPPSADIRDDIKTGMYDAIVFTSASSVRNMLGIAGKPHAASVIAAIGEATAAACEQHGLRVDVIADAPSFEALAESLARFADRRRQDQVEKGLPLKKPSERKRRRRRKSVGSDS